MIFSDIHVFWFLFQVALPPASMGNGTPVGASVLLAEILYYLNFL
jgi:hypothetical protein